MDAEISSSSPVARCERDYDDRVQGINLISVFCAKNDEIMAVFLDFVGLRLRGGIVFAITFQNHRLLRRRICVRSVGRTIFSPQPSSQLNNNYAKLMRISRNLITADSYSDSDV